MEFNDTAQFDPVFNKFYLPCDEVKRVVYYESTTKKFFDIDVKKDAIKDKIYLTIISDKAGSQFSLMKEGIVCSRQKFSNKNTDVFQLKTKLDIGEEVLVNLEDGVNNWCSAIVVSEQTSKRQVQVELLKGPNRFAHVNLNRVAYFVPNNKALIKAYRVVAKIFCKNNIVTFIAGRIVDLAKTANKFRYLIFFENGLVSYVAKQHLAIVADQSRGLEGFSPREKAFVSNYFKLHPEIPLAKCKIGEYKTIKFKVPNQNFYEKLPAKVIRIDCKLVKFHIDKYDTHVWVFRGDYTKIDCLNDLSKQINKKTNPSRHRPIRNLDVSSQQKIEEIIIEDEQDDQDQEMENFNRDDLKLIEDGKELSNIYEKIDNYGKRKSLVEKDHNCNYKCINEKLNGIKIKGMNMYLIPITFGWKRLYEFTIFRNKKIFYLTPCGKLLSNITQVWNYLKKTNSILHIDQFCFDKNFVLEQKIEFSIKHYIFIEDISKGTEIQPISLINSIDSTSLNMKFVYMPYREFKSNLKKVLDKNFLVCCDCTDNCEDDEKCACKKLTKESYTPIMEIFEFPIENRILKQKILSGIYECNQSCSCNERCLNRIVQLGIRNKLQVFKTLDKGWGVRTLHDIPKGSFICTYSGMILDDEAADSEGVKFGDQYLADLDLIENLQEAKFLTDEDTSFNLDSSESSFHDNLRTFYGEKEMYAINGKLKGNVGRFLNHSCNPNSFAQNVFVDTHDLRFPWLSFFSSKHIPAYTEITWDYDYRVDCVPGKKIFCHCKSDNCRKRLL